MAKYRATRKISAVKLPCTQEKQINTYERDGMISLYRMGVRLKALIGLPSVNRHKVIRENLNNRRECLNTII